MKTINITIPINSVTKKNHSQIIKARGHFMIVPSKPYNDYQRECGKYLKGYSTIKEPVNIKCLFYMQTRRKIDLSNLLASISDILVHYEILEDDNRDIIVGYDGSRVYYDKENPRCEITITPFEEEYSFFKKNDIDSISN